jgi:hypothetical protein
MEDYNPDNPYQHLSNDELKTALSMSRNETFQNAANAAMQRELDSRLEKEIPVKPQGLSARLAESQRARDTSNIEEPSIKEEDTKPAPVVSNPQGPISRRLAEEAAKTGN